MLNFIKNLALEAGALAMKRRKSLSISGLHFKNAKDLVTDVDREVEQFIRSAVEAKYPDHAFLGEEGGLEDHNHSEYLWIVDPIDGTTSYVHDSPMYSVSIGIRKNGVPFAGAIGVPRLNELYYAQAGKGAFLNDEQIHVSSRDQLVHCVAETGFACLRAGRKKNTLPHFCRIAPLVRDIRRLGSAAIDMAFVAAGRSDFFWEMELQPYDIAAGEIILLEAGGRVTDFEGGTDYPVKKGIVASNGIVHDKILELLAMD